MTACHQRAVFVVCVLFMLSITIADGTSENVLTVRDVTIANVAGPPPLEKAGSQQLDQKTRETCFQSKLQRS